MGETFGGSATVTPVSAPSFGGTAVVTFGDAGVGGVATIDTAKAQAWSAAHRMTDVRVLIDGEDVSGLVGAVRIRDDGSGPGLSCEFELVDERNASLHYDSFAVGGRTVEVWVTSRSRTGTDTRRVFLGTTESPSNAESYAPLATYRAIGAGAIWSEEEVCIRVPAFSGLRRFDVLRDEAALRGMTLATTTQGAQLTKPWEFVGARWWDFLERQAELEDIYWRPEVDGSLTGLTWAEVQAQAPALTIRWSNSFPPREDPPSAPPTALILSGARLTDDVRDQTDRTFQVSVETETFGRKSGRVWKVRVVGGVTVQSIEEEYETWPLAGEVEGADEYRLRRRTTVNFTYPTVTLLNGETRYTPALSGRGTEVEEYGAPQTHEEDALAVLWTDGTYRTQSEETFALRQRVTETFTYQPDDGSAKACQLDTTTIEVERYYAPMVAQERHQDDGTETTLYRWADGSYRGRETFVTTRETVESWTDTIGEDGPRRVTRRQDISAFIEATPEKSYTWPSGQATTISPSEDYRYAGAITDTWAESHLNGLGERIRAAEDQTTGEDSYSPSMERIPDIPRASALVPQYASEAFMVRWALTDHAYPTNVVRDFLEAAETTGEAVRAARRRMRWALATRWTVPMPFLPGLARWSKVTFIDETRSTGAAGVEAYVLGHALDADPTNGWLGLEVTLGYPREVE